MSQLLLRIERELSECSDRSRRSELLARKACVLTRLGRFDEAKSLIALLREKHGDWSSGLTHVWIMVAEGLVHWYGERSALALDRLTRAQVLSLAMKYDTVVAISSAWKAHIEFEVSNFDGMFRSLQIAKKHADWENSDARSRIAIVLCNVFWLCGNSDGAKRWFTEGRSVALADGDHASIDALQYNRASLAIAWLRAESFLGELSIDAIRSARGEINSAQNIHAINNIQTLRNHLSLWDARLRVLEGDYEGAIARLEEARGIAPVANYQSNPLVVDLEIAYCKFKLGRSDYRRDSVSDTTIGSLIDLDIDDKFVAISMVCELRDHDPLLGASPFLTEQRALLRAAYVQSRVDLTTALTDFCAQAIEDSPQGILPTNKADAT